jgi:hypothetical protein
MRIEHALEAVFANAGCTRILFWKPTATLAIAAQAPNLAAFAAARARRPARVQHLLGL